MKIALSIWSLLTLALLSGCKIYVVDRRARVAFMPEPEKIVAAMKASPKVSGVRYSFHVEPPNQQVHKFQYRGGIVQFTKASEQNIMYYQYSLSSIAQDPSTLEDWFNSTRLKMLGIEKQLEENCGLTNFQSSVIEYFDPPQFRR